MADLGMMIPTLLLRSTVAFSVVRFSFNNVKVFLAVRSPAASYIRYGSFIFLRHGLGGNEVDRPQDFFKWVVWTKREKWKVGETMIFNQKIENVNVRRSDVYSCETAGDHLPKS